VARIRAFFPDPKFAPDWSKTPSQKKPNSKRIRGEFGRIQGEFKANSRQIQGEFRANSNDALGEFKSEFGQNSGAI